MNRTLLISAITAVTCIAIVSCNTDSSKMKESVTRSSAEVTSVEIPYQTVNNYFINNDIDKVPELITTQSEFTKCFGMATVMGNDGKPTDIDFNKQFVIVTAAPETDIATAITPVSLEKVGDSLVFTCKMLQEEQQSYTTHPFVMVKVDRQYEGPVKVKIMK